MKKPHHAGRGRAVVSSAVAADEIRNRLSRPLGQTPRFVRWPVWNDDGHLIGHELLRIGPGLDRYLTQLAEEAGR